MPSFDYQVEVGNRSKLIDCDKQAFSPESRFYRNAGVPVGLGREGVHIAVSSCGKPGNLDSVGSVA